MEEGNRDEASHVRWWRLLWREQPAFALTIIYIVLGGAGSYYYTQLFSHFGVNIFYYAEVGDFLLVIFREPLVPGLTIAAGLMLYVIFRIDSALDHRFPNYKRATGWFQRWLESDPYFGKRGRTDMIWEGIIVVIVLLFVRIITPFCVKYTVSEIKKTSRRQVFIQLSGESERSLRLGSSDLRLIGTTGRFIFVFEPQTKLTQIIPVESIARITVGGDSATNPSVTPDGNSGTTE